MLLWKSTFLYSCLTDKKHKELSRLGQVHEKRVFGAVGQNIFSKQVSENGNFPIGRNGKVKSSLWVSLDLAPFCLRQQRAAA